LFLTSKIEVLSKPLPVYISCDIIELAILMYCVWGGKNMAHIIEYIKEQEFTKRELVLGGVALFLLGIVLGVALSPKGDRTYGCNNGNNNTGHFNDDKDDKKLDCDDK